MSLSLNIVMKKLILGYTHWCHEYAQDSCFCSEFTVQVVWIWEEEAKPADSSSYSTGSYLSKKQSQEPTVLAWHRNDYSEVRVLKSKSSDLS